VNLSKTQCPYWIVLHHPKVHESAPAAELFCETIRRHSPSRGIIGLEKAAMDCARAAGLQVPDTCIVPSEDLTRLFRHAICKGLVGNTDDHLKNFAMIHDIGGYRLAPAALRWGVADALGILENVLVGLSRFEEFAALAGVPDVNVAEIGKDLGRRSRRVAHRGA
jgi:hypothetical protein